MTYDEDDQDALAAEYVLGTLDRDERTQAQVLIALDPGFAAVVRAWERRFGELNVMVEPVEPPPETWSRIRSTVFGGAGPAAQVEPLAPIAPSVPVTPSARVEPRAHLQPPVQPIVQFEPTVRFEPTQPIVHIGPGPLVGPVAPIGPTAEVVPVAKFEFGTEKEFAAPGDFVAQRPPPRQLAPEEEAAPAAEVVAFRRRAGRWRAIAGLTGALAASLLIYMAVWELAPERLPPSLRLPHLVQVQVVEKEIPPPPAAPTPARFVAVLQREPSAPAFLVTVDLHNRMLTVRRVAAEKEPGKSYELWLVSNRIPRPRSLGVVGADEFTSHALAGSYNADVVHTATYAISLEPEGGSPTGSPTGPVLFTGRLVESLPARAPGTP